MPTGCFGQDSDPRDLDIKIAMTCMGELSPGFETWQIEVWTNKGMHGLKLQTRKLGGWKDFSRWRRECFDWAIAEALAEVKRKEESKDAE